MNKYFAKKIVESTGFFFFNSELQTTEEKDEQSSNEMTKRYDDIKEERSINNHISKQGNRKLGHNEMLFYIYQM